jgi:putative SOS response-associated peptidase YedK
MCNLYSVMSSRAEIARMADAAFDYNHNAPPTAGVYPDYPATVVLKEEGGRRVLRDLRWGMPSSSQALFTATEKRANALRAKGKEVDFNELLKVEPDRGTTNVRNTTSKATGKINAHWGRWLGPANRCLVPMTSFAEPDQVGGSRQNIWFAFDEARPLSFFAGIWTPWTCVRKVSEGMVTCDVFGFLTTDANDDVGAFHDKAMPVILTEREEIDAWMSDAPWPEVAHLQRPLQNGALKIVARGGKSDPAGAPAPVGDLI